MAKKILNMSLFEDKLNKNLISIDDTQVEQPNGLSNVIKYVWNHYPTSIVDFDSFHLKDLYEAKNYMYAIPESDQEEEEEETDDTTDHIKNNPWIENFLVENTISALYHSKKVVYENEDDFI